MVECKSAEVISTPNISYTLTITLVGNNVLAVARKKKKKTEKEN